MKRQKSTMPLAVLLLALLLLLTISQVALEGLEAVAMMFEDLPAFTYAYIVATALLVGGIAGLAGVKKWGFVLTAAGSALSALILAVPAWIALASMHFVLGGATPSGFTALEWFYYGLIVVSPIVSLLAFLAITQDLWRARHDGR